MVKKKHLSDLEKRNFKSGKTSETSTQIFFLLL